MREISNSDPLREIFGHSHHPSDSPWPGHGFRPNPQCKPASCNSAPIWVGNLKLAGLVVASSFLLTGGSTMASAADMAMKASQRPLYQWSGCYAGVNLGGGASGTNFGSAVDPGTYLLGADPALVASGGNGGHSGDGLQAGGQVGCNLQSGSLVMGLEGDFDYFHSRTWFSDNSNTLSDGVTPFTISPSLTTEYLATIRPRVGIAADRDFSYVTGGVAFTGVSYLESYSDGAAPPGSGSAAASKSVVGWVAGAGWEHALADHWTFRAEYLYASFGTVNATGTITEAGVGTNTLHGSSDLTIQMLRAGLNFKF